MGFLPVCNSTLENEKVTEVPIVGTWTMHRFGEYVGGACCLLAVAQSFFLIFMHATHYLKPWEQKHIIRILFMIPIYATVSWLSIRYYLHSVYLEVIRDCYEAFAIASFFTLLCHYIAPDLHEQKNYFRTIKPRQWVWPLPTFQKCCGGEHGIWRIPRSGLTWFNVIWVGVFQYCFVRVFMTFVALITQAAGRYCLESLNPLFSHIWVMVFEAIAVTIAMYCIIQFYIQIKTDIAIHKPLLKVLAIKLVIFLSFWQEILISFLTSTGLIKPSEKFQTPDIKVGIPAFLLCVEMAFFAFFHFFAFSWVPYTPKSVIYQSELAAGEDAEVHYKGGFLGLKAIIDAANVWDVIKAVARSAKWLFKGRKTRMLDSSYAVARTGAGGGDSMMNLDQTAYSNTKLNPMGGDTSYTGASGESVGPGPGPAPPPRYPGVDDDQQPLVYQKGGQPFVDPQELRDHSPSGASLTGLGLNEMDAAVPGDIGTARSTSDDDEVWDDRGRSNHQGPAIQITPPSDVGAEQRQREVDGFESVPYPMSGRTQRQEMPYYHQPRGPPPSGRDWGRR